MRKCKKSKQHTLAAPGSPAEPPAEYLGIAVPVYEPGFLPMQLFSGDGILESKLQRIVCKKRITLTATTTEALLGGLNGAMRVASVTVTQTDELTLARAAAWTRARAAWVAVRWRHAA